MRSQRAVNMGRIGGRRGAGYAKGSMRLKVVAVASTKGGVGKSTLTACLSVRAAKDSPRVAMIDMDPQGSLLGWWTRRGQPKNPRLMIGAERTLHEELASLDEQGWDYVFIDTPPAMLDIIERGVTAAHFVVIPLKASSLDVLAVDVIIETCQQHGVPYGLVINDAEMRWRITASAAEALTDCGPLLATVGHRAAYVSAMTTGRTGPESADVKRDGDAAAEINALWLAVLTSIEGGRK